MPDCYTILFIISLLTFVLNNTITMISCLSGIKHSKNRNAVMAPVYQGYKRHFRLQEDDIEAIQSLYGQYLSFMKYSPECGSVCDVLLKKWIVNTVFLSYKCWWVRFIPALSLLHVENFTLTVCFMVRCSENRNLVCSPYFSYTLYIHYNSQRRNM